MSEDADLLQTLLDQEKRLVFTRFDNETGIALGMRIIARARADKLPIVVDVSRGDQRLFYCALPGTTADNEYWVAGKIAVVRRFGHSSFYMGQRARIRGVDFAAGVLVDPAQYRAHGGAFPVIVRDVGIVGTVTVSGLAQQDDHKLVVAVIEEYLAELGAGEPRAEVWTA